MAKGIVLFGVAGSGKDTLGAAITEKWAHLGMHTASFASPIKEAAKAMFGFSDEDLYGPSANRTNEYPQFPFSGWCFKCNVQSAEHYLDGDVFAGYLCASCGEEYPPCVTPRLICQTLGTEYGRRIYKGLWATRLMQTEEATGKPFAVTDGRFYNELEASEAAGCFTILLLRGLEDSTSTHSSEAEIRTMAKEHPERFNAVLDNREGTIEENVAKLFQLLEYWAVNNGLHDVDAPYVLTAKQAASLMGDDDYQIIIQQAIAIPAEDPRFPDVLAYLTDGTTVIHGKPSPTKLLEAMKLLEAVK